MQENQLHVKPRREIKTASMRGQGREKATGRQVCPVDKKALWQSTAMQTFRHADCSGHLTQTLCSGPPVANSLGKHTGAWTLTQTNRPLLIAHEKAQRRREGGSETDAGRRLERNLIKP